MPETDLSPIPSNDQESRAKTALFDCSIDEICCPDGRLTDLFSRKCLYGACLVLGIPRPSSLDEFQPETLTLGQIKDLLQMDARDIKRAPQVGKCAMENFETVRIHIQNGEIWRKAQKSI
jgi:hypothetical protein